MRYAHMIGHAPPSPSASEVPNKIKKGPIHVEKPRLPTSRHHHIRKASLSTSSSSMPSIEQPAKATKKPKSLTLIPNALQEVEAEYAPPRTPKPPIQIKAWESYLRWLALTEEPGTLWISSLCATFEDCLGPESSVKASECAARIDDVYWSFYLPLDPLRAKMEDRILSGYLLHVWTMFIELGKRIPHDDGGQDRLVELLCELVHLPPMEVRTWDGNDAPWTDLPTLDDALLTAWDDLYDPEIQASEPESHWLNYFGFLGRLVSADVTPDWWEIPATTLKEVLAEDVSPTPLTKSKTMALAEFMNQAGEAFLEWCLESGMLDAGRDFALIEPLTRSPVQLDWFENRGSKNF